LGKITKYEPNKNSKVDFLKEVNKHLVYKTRKEKLDKDLVKNHTTVSKWTDANTDWSKCKFYVDENGDIIGYFRANK
tara:strand:+ start:4400 stop:4630 length:231 start_codon:yes stop_codon:yes gene_type:complete